MLTWYNVTCSPTLQIAVFVIPFCVVLAWMLDRDLDLNFNAFEVSVCFGSEGLVLACMCACLFVWCVCVCARTRTHARMLKAAGPAANTLCMLSTCRV